MYLVSLIDTQLDNTLDTHLSVTACSVLQQHGVHIADVKPIRSALCKREKSQHTHTHTHTHTTQSRKVDNTVVVSGYTYRNKENARSATCI